MVLAKSKIIKAIESQKIIIKSVIEGYDYKQLLGANSLDLTLGKWIKVYSQTDGWKNIDLSSCQYRIEKGDLVLGVTNEWIFCDGFYPSLRDKSSMGRNFSTAINGGAGSGDNRFAGHYTIEIKSEIPLTLTYGMLIVQIVFHEAVGDGDYNDGGRYANEFTGEHPKPEECKGFKNVFDIIEAKTCVVDSGFEGIQQYDVSKKCYIYGIEDSFGRIDTQVVDFVGESINLECQDQNGVPLYFNDDALHLLDWCKKNNLKYLFKEVQIDFNY